MSSYSCEYAPEVASSVECGCGGEWHAIQCDNCAGSFKMQCDVCNGDKVRWLRCPNKHTVLPWESLGRGQAPDAQEPPAAAKKGGGAGRTDKAQPRSGADQKPKRRR